MIGLNAQDRVLAESIRSSNTAIRLRIKVTAVVKELESKRNEWRRGVRTERCKFSKMKVKVKVAPRWIEMTCRMGAGAGKDGQMHPAPSTGQRAAGSGHPQANNRPCSIHAGPAASLANPKASSPRVKPPFSSSCHPCTIIHRTTAVPQVTPSIISPSKCHVFVRW